MVRAIKQLLAMEKQHAERDALAADKAASFRGSRSKTIYVFAAAETERKVMLADLFAARAS